MAKQVARMKLDVTVKLGDTEYRCSNIALNFAMNSIPFARASLALGREIHSQTAAKVHSTANSLTQMLPAQIILHPSGEWNVRDGGRGFGDGRGRWDDAGSQVIFDGYLTGSGYQKQQGVVQFNVHLIHWLSDLSFSSCLSNQSHPANPARFRWLATQAVLRLGAGADANGGEQKPHFVADYRGENIFTPANIQSDFWGDALHPFFCALSNLDILDPTSGSDGCTGMGGANDYAQNALKRIERAVADEDTVGDSCEDGASSPYHKKCSLNLGFKSQQVAEAIGMFCTRQQSSNYWNSTLWDILVGKFSPHMALHVVPRVQTAIIAPFIPGLRRTYDMDHGESKVLDMQDISHIATSSFIPRPLRGVGILSAVTNGTNAQMRPDPLRHLGGCFAPDDASGMLMYVQGPEWLRGVADQAQSLKNTALAKAPGSATTPQKRGENVGDDNGDTPIGVANELSSYYDAAAHSLYAQEMLRGRHATVQGKLRFDIAPGTNIKLKTQYPIHLQNDQLSEAMVATVSQVGVVIDAEALQATTTFGLEHVRSAEENQDERTSVESHPLYNETFSGSPLLHAYLFGDS